MHCLSIFERTIRRKVQSFQLIYIETHDAKTCEYLRTISNVHIAEVEHSCSYKKERINQLLPYLIGTMSEGRIEGNYFRENVAYVVAR